MTSLSACVIGYGNPLREDDGLGFEAAAALCAGLSDREDVEVHACHQLTVDLAEVLSRAECAVFVDAANEGEEAGRVRLRRLTASDPAAGSFTHHLTPGTLLGLCRALYGRAPEGVLVSVSGAEFGFGDGLSPRVGLALPGVVGLVRAICLEGVGRAGGEGGDGGAEVAAGDCAAGGGGAGTCVM